MVLVAEYPCHRRVRKPHRAVRVHHDHRVGRVFPEQPVALLAIAQGLFGCSAGLAAGGFAHLALDCGDQPGQVALHEIIVGPGLHGSHGNVFTNPPGNNNKGQIERGIL